MFRFTGKSTHTKWLVSPGRFSQLGFAQEFFLQYFQGLFWASDRIAFFDPVAAIDLVVIAPRVALVSKEINILVTFQITQTVGLVPALTGVTSG
jgi:hypothetical protein